MEVISRFLNLFFPPQCTSCRKEGSFLCENCVGKLRVISIKKIPRKHHDRSEFKHLNGVIYAADYTQNPQLKAAIKQFKYRFTRELTEQFSTLMNQKLSELWMVQSKPVVLIPVPLHQKRLDERGFNQADLLANGVVSRYRGMIEINPLLIRVKHTSQQAKLDRVKRLKNLRDAFEVIGGMKALEDKVCFLVDDVCTTGSTLDECARMLKEEGLEKVYALVLARANNIVSDDHQHKNHFSSR